MKSDNPHSGFYEAGTARTLDANGGNPSCNQGGMAVVALQGSMIGRKDKNGPQGSGINKDASSALDATDHHAARHPVYCTSKNSHHTIAEKELANTLVATDYKDPPRVAEEQAAEPHYIVRRLTPTECARLQGFPDWWTQGLKVPEPDEGTVRYWEGVFEAHRAATGKPGRKRSRGQIVRWLKNPDSDTALYKMWGNGISLPIVFFVLSGIVWAYSEDLPQEMSQ